MAGIHLQFDSLSEECITVLAAYASRDAVRRAAEAEFNGWLDRITDLPGVAAEQLTGIHGRLIAQGLLRFEIVGRSVGLQYQLSPQGRELLSRAAGNLSSGHTSEHDSGDEHTDWDHCSDAA